MSADDEVSFPYTDPLGRVVYADARPTDDPVRPDGGWLYSDGSVHYPNGVTEPAAQRAARHRAFEDLHAAIDVSNAEQAVKRRAHEVVDALRVAHEGLALLGLIPVAGPFLVPAAAAIEDLLRAVAGKS